MRPRTPEETSITDVDPRQCGGDGGYLAGIVAGFFDAKNCFFSDG